MPAGRPIASAMSMEQSASSSVTGTLERSRSATGMRLRSDSPKSPRSTLPTQIPYCTATARSRWYLARMAATTAASCSSPASATAGSLGSRCCSEKMSTDTKNSVGTSTASRRAMYSQSVIRRRPSVQLHPAHTDDAVRMRREALHLAAHAGVHAPVPQVQPRDFLQQDLGGRIVELLALRRVGDVARLGHERVEV